MKNSDLSEEAKEPVLIPPKSLIAKQIILKAHGKYHANPGQTATTVRQKYWIPQLMQQLRSILRKCVPCQTFNNSPFKYPDMAQLPPQRVQRSTPFDHAGVDGFGPITIQMEGSDKGSTRSVLSLFL
ncbi:hypothetical protein B9Z55_028143 [Caenorhabditis nigoni]|uniref:Integrase zinc-binding domain-containing protein n=1 Tax=Caenorhabditis nigoni TaxID=1611254 RepID=A0A2G5SCU6_9PELO|nr:hypothetical protein B9Z55_028143 [Caenorhabditis nigoni]